MFGDNYFMAFDDYRVSFTTGGLYYSEAIKISAMYLEIHDWDTIRRRILAENTLQSRTRATTGRTLCELLPRLRLLTDEQLLLLVDGSREERNQVLWLAVCKQYRLVREFAVEVLREKFLRLDLEVSYRDFDAFFNSKAEWHVALEKLTAVTRKKLRQVLFRTLREADILSKTGQILPVVLSPRVARAIARENASDYTVFPISETDYRRQAAR